MIRKYFSRSLLRVGLLALLAIVQESARVNAQNHLQQLETRDPKLYTNYEVLDNERKYVLEWVVNWKKKEILFNVTVKTNGYITFGLSSDGKLPGSDIIIGGVDNQGKPYFGDLYANDEGTLMADSIQNWQLEGYSENSSHTMLTISRPFETCDPHDVSINEFDMIKLLWGYEEAGDNPPLLQKDLAVRGHYPIYLLDPNTVPRSLKEKSFNPAPPPAELLTQENLKLWTVLIKNKVPQTDTSYYCNMHKAPFLGKKHHIVGFQARLDNELVFHVHHVLIFRCSPPKGSTASEFFERFLKKPGSSCFFMTEPSNDLPGQYCTDLKVAHSGRNLKMMFYPDHLGSSIGETGSEEYFITQIHYNNPTNKSSLDFDVNFDIYYTDKLRPYEAGILPVGYHIPGPLLIIPGSTGSTSGFRIFGHCSPECTSSILPEIKGIKISSVQVHTHLSGTKMTMHHFRHSKELPFIVDDENYDNFYQPFRLLQNEVNILQGDHLTLECEYDNTWANDSSTLGGFTTKHEMCASYLVYYNKLEKPGLCRSNLEDPNYMKRYLGVTNITWDETKLEYVATSPVNLTGRTLTSLANEQNWSPALRAQLQEDQRSLPQVSTCVESVASEEAGNGVSKNMEETYLVSYPTNINKYVRKSSDECKFQNDL